MPNENSTVPPVIPSVQAPVVPKIVVGSGSGITPMPAIVQGDQKASPPKPKKKISLILAMILGGVLLLGLIFFLIKNVFTGGKKGSEISLTYWGLWEEDAAIKPLIAEYEAANPKVKINYIKQSQHDYRERLTNALAKVGAPDIFRFHNTWVPMLKKDLDYLPASVMTATDFAQSFYPVASDDLTSGTGIVGIPLMYDGLTLFINEDIFSAAGKVPPSNWD
jgi:ABC-type glycerol-3-phosphate transport system substrate-binding protein